MSVQASLKTSSAPGRSHGEAQARDWAGDLLEQGYCIIPELVPAATVKALHDDLRPRFARTPFCVGDFYGGRTKRFGGLLKHSPHAATFVQHRLILEIVQTVLG